MTRKDRETTAVKDAEDLKVLPNYKSFKALEDIRPLVNRLVSLNGEKRVLEAQVAQLNLKRKDIEAEIGAGMVESDLHSVRVVNNRVTLVQGERESISKIKLLELGVLAKVITKATKVSSYSFVKITEIKE